MDQPTLEYYNQNARQLFERYTHPQKEGISSNFDRSFEPDSSILDIGCGSGRDLNNLIQKGYDAYGVAPCTPLLEMAGNHFPLLKDRLFTGHLPASPAALNQRKFDGLLCSAVLMHIRETDLFDTVYVFKILLKDGGRLLLFIPYIHDDLTSDERDQEGRLMIMRNPWALSLLFERTGFQKIDSWENQDSLSRQGVKWVSFLFRFREEQVLRPIDEIEGVLNRDKKNATYKLALFRALCDIELTEYRRVSVHGMKIGVLLEDIVDKWNRCPG